MLPSLRPRMLGGGGRTERCCTERYRATRGSSRTQCAEMDAAAIPAVQWQALLVMVTLLGGAQAHSHGHWNAWTATTSSNPGPANPTAPTSPSPSPDPSPSPSSPANPTAPSSPSPTSDSSPNPRPSPRPSSSEDAPVPSGPTAVQGSPVSAGMPLATAASTPSGPNPSSSGTDLAGQGGTSTPSSPVAADGSGGWGSGGGDAGQQYRIFTVRFCDGSASHVPEHVTLPKRLRRITSRVLPCGSACLAVRTPAGSMLEVSWPVRMARVICTRPRDRAVVYCFAAGWYRQMCV